MQDNSLLKYKKISNSQVLLHPHPKGIIQFIGSFIFGSFPATAYKSLHEFLFDHGYSLILYRFPFNPTQFNHWEVAINLFKEQQKLKTEIIKILKLEHKSTDIMDKYLCPENYLWLGHSLGCKYIALLEVLSGDPSTRMQTLQKCLGKENAEKIIDSLNSVASTQAKAASDIQQLLPEMKPSGQLFIRDQPSVLLAPEISNTVRFLKSDWRIPSPWISPNRQQTKCLISSSKDLFNLTGIISFSSDNIAEDDVAFLVEEIKTRHFQPHLHQELEGCHIEPLNDSRIEILGDRILQFFDMLQARKTK